MTPTDDDGPHRGNRRGQDAAEGDAGQRTACLPVRTSLAVAMRAEGVDHRTIWAVAGEDADHAAVEVESWDRALAHLAAHDLAGTVPPEVTSIRRMSRRWA